MNTTTEKPDASKSDATEAVFKLLPAIFQECVEAECLRFDLSLPRPVGPYIYAIDGIVAVRVPADFAVVAAIPPLAEDRRFPSNSIPGLFVGEWDDSPTALPDVAGAPVCPTCKGACSFKARECPKCDGEGDFICPECKQDVTCPKCDGDGELPAGPCESCAGSGVDYGANTGVEVGKGLKLSYRFLAMLRRHGATMYLPTDPGMVDGKATRPIRFTVPGGVEGVVMPLSSR